MKILISNKHIFINALLFQVVWFTAVLGEWFFAVLPLSLMIIQLTLLQKRLLISLTALFWLACGGISFDSIFHYIGVYQFSIESYMLPLFNLPMWLACLWLGFCFTLPLSLTWLLRKPYLFILSCCVLGPVSYLAGMRLGALSFSHSNIGLLVAEWCVFSILALIWLLPKLGKSKVSPHFS